MAEERVELKPIDPQNINLDFTIYRTILLPGRD